LTKRLSLITCLWASCKAGDIWTQFAHNWEGSAGLCLDYERLGS
jgi:hypothetical protein